MEFDPNFLAGDTVSVPLSMFKKGSTLVGRSDGEPVVAEPGTTGQVYTVGEDGIPVFADASGGGGAGATHTISVSWAREGQSIVGDIYEFDSISVLDAANTDVTPVGSSFEVGGVAWDSGTLTLTAGIWAVDARGEIYMDPYTDEFQGIAGIGGLQDVFASYPGVTSMSASGRFGAVLPFSAGDVAGYLAQNAGVAITTATYQSLALRFTLLSAGE